MAWRIMIHLFMLYFMGDITPARGDDGRDKNAGITFSTPKFSGF